MKVKVDIALTAEEFNEKSLDILLAKIKHLRYRSRVAYQNKKLFPSSMNIIPEHQLIFGKLFKSINPNRKLIVKYNEFSENYLSEIKNLWIEYYSYLRSNTLPFDFENKKYNCRLLRNELKDSLVDMSSLITTNCEATKLYLQLSVNYYLRKSVSKHILALVLFAEGKDLNNFISEYQSIVLHYGFYSSQKKIELDERIKKLIPINN